MIVRCLHCGEDMECSNGLERGQNVRCPSCGGKFAYDGEQTKKDPSESDTRIPTRPRLGILRSQPGQGGNEKVKESIAVPLSREQLALEKLRAQEAMRQRDWLRTLTGWVVKSIVILIALGIGWWAYLSWCERPDDGRVAECLREISRLEAENAKVSDANRELMGKWEAAAGEVGKQQRELKDMSSTIEELRNKIERRTNGSGGDNHHPDNEGKGSSKGDSNKNRPDGKIFCELAKEFQGDDLTLYASMPKDAKAGKTLDQILCAVPRAELAFVIYRVAKEDGKVVTKRYEDGKDSVTVDFSDLESDASKNGGLYSIGAHAYLRPTPSPTLTALVPAAGEQLVPGDLVCGRMAALARLLGIDDSALEIDVFLSAKRYGRLSVNPVGITDAFDRDAFATVVSNVLYEQKLERVVKNVRVPRKPKQTVIVDNCKMPYRDIHGLMHCPKVFWMDENPRLMDCEYYWRSGRDKCHCSGCKYRRQVTNARKRWDDLMRQAEEEQRALADWQQKVNALIEQYKARVRVTEAEISAVLKNATVEFKLRPVKASATKITSSPRRRGGSPRQIEKQASSSHPGNGLRPSTVVRVTHAHTLFPACARESRALRQWTFFATD